MFFLSKVMVLGSLITGSSGISAYLIPYKFRKEHLTTLFQTSTSFHESKNSEVFENKEGEKLKKIVYERGDTLSKFICAIENGGQIENKCEKLSLSWVLWDSQNKSLINSGGGHTRAILKWRR